MGVLYARVSGAWVPIGNSPANTPWTPFTPVLRAGGVLASFGSATPLGRYKVIDTVCTFTIKYAFGAGASAGGGVFEWNFPFPLATGMPSFSHVGSGHIIQASARKNCALLINSATTFCMYIEPTGQVLGNSPQVVVGDGGNLSGYSEIAP